MTDITQTPLLELEGIKKYFPIKGGILKRTQGQVKAVENVNLTVFEGESLGIVGESGCGKSTFGRTVLGLETLTEGKITYKGQDMSTVNRLDKKAFVKEMQMIFQDPYASLDPRQKVGKALEEIFIIHTDFSASVRKEKVLKLLKEVGLRAEHYDKYPHEFSGGQRQRVGIARAIALNPSLVVCDEAVSALDVSVQAQVIQLLKHIQNEYKLTYMFISHDLGVVRYFCDRVLVMYLGNTVELAPVEKIYSNPMHPYTKALLAAIPRPDPTINRDRIRLTGELPNPANPPKGCAFHTRCPIATERCKMERPAWREIDVDHFVACHEA